MRTFIFVWENFGPGHADRCEAVALAGGTQVRVLGLEMFGRSSTYEWISESRPTFEKLTLFEGLVVEDVPVYRRLLRLLRVCLPLRNCSYFLCHYERPEIFMLACILRLLRRTVIVMADSKFDDYPRRLSLEVLKYFLHLPYCGGIASGRRSIDYLRFLGISSSSLGGNYNALSLERIRRLASERDEVEIDFESRHFIVVARLVPKKNIPNILRAFALYTDLVDNPRRLQVLGSGPLSNELKGLASDLGISPLVDWFGFVQTDVVCRTLSRSLALLLISTEEQFGNVVIEASALGVPCIVSVEVGARDQLVRSGVNGFIVESDNPEGVAHFLKVLSEDQSLWTSFRSKAIALSHLGDANCFADACLRLVAACK